MVTSPVGVSANVRTNSIYRPLGQITGAESNPAVANALACPPVPTSTMFRRLPMARYSGSRLEIMGRPGGFAPMVPFQARIRPTFAESSEYSAQAEPTLNLRHSRSSLSPTCTTRSIDQVHRGELYGHPARHILSIVSMCLSPIFIGLDVVDPPAPALRLSPSTGNPHFPSSE